MKVDLLLTLPVCLSASSCLYHSYEVNRMAILGMIPPRTAPRPLYRPRAVSFFTISTPVVKNPRGFTYKNMKMLAIARISFNWYCKKGKTHPGSFSPPRKLHPDLDGIYPSHVSAFSRCQLRQWVPYLKDGKREPPSYRHHHQLLHARLAGTSIIVRQEV